jgi:monooxygenase
VATELVEPAVEHLDVLVVGAGISGIDAAYHLESAGKRYAILEARGAIGGTWDLFRYPGIRSDSDMYTLGFPFRPWDSDKSIADGTSIREYVEATARDYGIDAKIRFHHKVIRADWSSEDQRWTVEAERADTGGTARFTCSFLFICSGYYRYDKGYTPQFPGVDQFAGQVVHPQFWSPDIDYEGKRVIVVGSGATAVTLVPALAEQAEHVTMLQRSPSYVISLPAQDPLARAARRWLAPRRAYSIIRWKNVLLAMLHFQLSRRRPELIKRLIRMGVEHHLPPGYDVDTHFKPRYNPWDQRLCLVPDADLFEAISSGRASVVTDQIETFTERGLRLASGGELEADIIVTATGLDLVMFGGAQLSVDGEAVDVAKTMVYRGCMVSDIPNFAYVFGYTNASWTLKADLTCRFVARLLRYMDEHGYASCVPHNRDPSVVPEPFVDFSSGYFLRALDRLPKQGTRRPWRMNHNYLVDLVGLRRPLEDETLEFARARREDRAAERVAAVAA